MKIEIINTNVIKVMLSPEDLMDFGTSADKLDQDDKNAGKVISDILTAVKIREGIDFSCRKLYIEAFDVCDGSCILYISAICGKKIGTFKGKTPDIVLNKRFYIFRQRRKVTAQIRKLHRHIVRPAFRASRPILPDTVCSEHSREFFIYAPGIF